VWHRCRAALAWCFQRQCPGSRDHEPLRDIHPPRTPLSWRPGAYQARQQCWKYEGERQGHAEPLQAHRALQESVSRSSVEAHRADDKAKAIPMAHVIPRTASRGRDLVLGCRDRNAARTTVGREFPICTLSVVQRVPNSTMVHVSASPPTIPDSRLSRVRFWPRLCTPFSRDSPSRPL
jgi:hypothetical protein